MKNIFSKAFNYLKDNPGEWGFNLTYSPKQTWNEQTKILVLTINPQTNNTKGEPVRNIPEGAFHDNHDFFKDDPFHIRKPIQGLFWELSNIYQPNNSAEPLKKSLDFASNSVAMASFVPWRTTKEQNIKTAQWDFAEQNIWKPLFNVWQPELIIQIGRTPFSRLWNLLNKDSSKYKEKYILQYMPEVTTPQTKKLKVRYGKCGRNNNITLINLPHPVGRGFSGYPVEFPEKAQIISPIGKFLRDVLRT